MIIPDFGFNIDTFLFIIFSIFVFSTFLQLIYYWLVFSKLAFYKKKEIKAPLRPVSVVISAKNEYYNLKEYLPHVLEQNYPDFEVIVVNDCSDDDSFFLLKDFEQKYKNLKIINITENVNFFTGKKFPLSIGIKSAKNDIVLLTDADCMPKSKNWIREIQAHFDEKTDIVLAYGSFFPKKGFLDKLIRFDEYYVALQYLSFSLAGYTYMGVGRNLAYRKKLFINNKGFISHYKVNSGDDDLFINEVATKKNTKIEISIDSQTFTKQKPNFVRWFRQKKRHYSTGKYYKPVFKILLFLLHSTSFWFYLSFFILMGFLFNYELVLALFAIRLVTQYIIFHYSMKNLQENKLLLISPLLDLFFVIFNPILIISNLIFKQNKWK